MSFKAIPLVAVVVLGLGNLLHIIGLATPEWLKIGRLALGLWEVCRGDDCSSFNDQPEWLEASQAMAILGMLAGLGALVMAVIIFIFRLMDKSSTKVLGIVSLLAAISSFVLIAIGVIIFAVKAGKDFSSMDYGYSFGLSIAGGILILLGGCVALAGGR